MPRDTSSKRVGSCSRAVASGWLAANILLFAALWVPGFVFGLQEEAENLTPRQRAGRAIVTAESASRQVLLLSDQPDFAVANRNNPELQALLDKGRRLLGFAKDGLAKAEQSQSETGFSDAALLARRATRQFEAYEESLRETFARLEEERKPQLEAPPAEPPPAEPPPPQVLTPPSTEPPATDESAIAADPAEKPSDEPSTLPSAVPASTGESKTAEPPSAGASPSEPASIEPPPAAAPLPTAANLGPPPSVPPPSRPSSPLPSAKLRQAADAFFAGEYEETVRLLVTLQSSSAKTQAHGLLLRSAARYALFLLGGETDYALRGLATEDVTACREASPDLVPNQEAFSPRFRDFFAGTQ